jgi:hypothetical protein
LIRLTGEHHDVGRIISTASACIGPTLDGNAGGDPYYTDGDIKISVLVAGCSRRSATVAKLANPPLMELKNSAWKAVKKLLMPNFPAAKRDD